MTDKADIYRKAAEIIVRDGKTEGTLSEAADEIGGLYDSHRPPVCAIGACARAEYELTGRKADPLENVGDSLYERYDFFIPSNGAQIWRYNDSRGISAEDVALELKRHAEFIEDFDGEVMT